MHIDVLMCDADLAAPTIKKFLPTQRLDFVGRGGTNLQPAFDKAAEEGYKAIICFTDGEFIDEIESEIQSLWVSVNNDCFKPSFGNVCFVNWNED
jgi:predicted metal-dependent peptidase